MTAKPVVLGYKMEPARFDRDITPEEIRGLVGIAPFIIEIGCNDGADTEAMLKAMPEARFHCFEPEQRAIARFRLGGHPQVELHPYGVLHKCGYVQFWPSTGAIRKSNAPCKDDWDYSGGFSVPTGHLERDKQVEFRPPVELPVVRLDDFFKDYGKPVSFIWADTQGSEAKVILGGNQTLAVTRYLYIEYYDEPQYDKEPDLKALCSFLPDFELVALYNGNALFRNAKL